MGLRAHLHRLAPAGLALSLCACPWGKQPEPTVTPAEGTGEEPDGELIPSAPANRAQGEQLDATIPVIGGGTLELDSLRARPVLIEISASWEPGFVEAHALYTELLGEHPELEVILVVADPEDAGLEGLPSNFHLAWDPAGALAAKLSVATFPTMFVLDREGRINYVDNGWSELVAASIADAVALVATSSGPLEYE